MNVPFACLYLLGAVGMTIILTMSKIASPIRTIYPHLLQCSLCTGTWIGAAAGTGLALQGQLGWLQVVPFSFSTALVAYLAGTWLREHDRSWPWVEHD